MNQPFHQADKFTFIIRDHDHFKDEEPEINLILVQIDDKPLWIDNESLHAIMDAYSEELKQAVIIWEETEVKPMPGILNYANRF